MSGMIYKSSELTKYDKDFVLSTSDIDRHFEIVDVEGINIDHFKRNPIMFYNHNHEQPIGKWEDIRKEGKKLLAKPVFYEADDFAVKIKKMVDSGIIKGASIGFTPLGIEKIKPPKEVENILNNFGYSYIKKYTSSILNEVSIVSIPANPYAIAKSLIDKTITINDLEDIASIDKIIANNFDEIEKIGAVLNRANYNRLMQIKSLVDEIIKSSKREEEQNNDNVNNDESYNKIYSLDELLNLF